MQELIAKYNTPAPRYTAYPPANYFTEKFTAADYLAEIDHSNSQGSSHISVYIHIPFCRNLCFYCGCNSYPQASQEMVNAYLQAVEDEMQLILGRLDSDRRIAQIHYGGGTPNTLPTAMLKKLNHRILSCHNTIEQPEIAIECHPALLTTEYIEELKLAGFNRFSIGIQDFNTETLRAVNRHAPVLPVTDIVNRLRDNRPDIAVNLDFIYGLPKQTVESFLRSMEEAIAIHPDRLVTFSYAHVPWVNKNQERLEKAGLPDLQTKTEMFLASRTLLQENGYQAIGIDHYVLPSDELYTAKQQGNLHRNFQGYCTQRTTGQVYAFGVSAISQLHRCYAQNTKSVTDYIASISARQAATVKGYHLSDDEAAIRTLLTGLMCNERIIWEEMAQETGYDITSLKTMLSADVCLEGFIADGIVENNNTGIYITEAGRLFTRNVTAALDPLLQRQSGKKFSKTM